MNEIDKAIEELQDMAFHPSLKKELSAETLTMAIDSLEKMKSAKIRKEIDVTEFREVLLKAFTEAVPDTGQKNLSCIQGRHP